MVRIALVEDDPRMAETLRGYLKMAEKKAGRSFEVEHFAAAEPFLTMPSHHYDVVLMDIELPGLNGMEAAKRLREEDEHIAILFVTNLAQYAVKGYAVRALDYIVKPVRYADFEEKINRAIKRVMQEKNDMVGLITPDGIRRVHASEINYVEVEGHLLTYHTEQGVFTERGGSMKSVENRFGGYSFLRVNNSCLVNLRSITQVDREQVMVGDTALHISQTRRKAFLAAIAAYFGQEEEE